MLLNAIANHLLSELIVNTVSGLNHAESIYIVVKSPLARKRALTNSLCANITCLNGGECFANENGPQCSCPSPYFGRRCEMSNESTVFCDERKD